MLPEVARSFPNISRSLQGCPIFLNPYQQSWKSICLNGWQGFRKLCSVLRSVRSGSQSGEMEAHRDNVTCTQLSAGQPGIKQCFALSPVLFLPQHTQQMNNIFLSHLTYVQRTIQLCLKHSTVLKIEKLDLRTENYVNLSKPLNHFIDVKVNFHIYKIKQLYLLT